MVGVKNVGVSEEEKKRVSIFFFLFSLTSSLVTGVTLMSHTKMKCFRAL